MADRAPFAGHVDGFQNRPVTHLVGVAGAADGFVFALATVVFKIRFDRLLPRRIRLGEVVDHPNATVTARADDASGVQIHRGNFIAGDGDPHGVRGTGKSKYQEAQKSFHTSTKAALVESSTCKRTRKSPAWDGAD